MPWKDGTRRRSCKPAPSSGKSWLPRSASESSASWPRRSSSSGGNKTKRSARAQALVRTPVIVLVEALLHLGQGERDMALQLYEEAATLPAAGVTPAGVPRLRFANNRATRETDTLMRRWFEVVAGIASAECFRDLEEIERSGCFPATRKRAADLLGRVATMAPPSGRGSLAPVAAPAAAAHRSDD